MILDHCSLNRLIVECQLNRQTNGPNHLLLAMLPTFGWQHCQWNCLQIFFSFLTELGNFKQKFFKGNAIGNVASQKSAAPRADDLDHYRFIYYF